MSTSTRPRSTSAPWGTNVRMPRAQRLNKDVRCDVCVIGAGIAGLSVAYELTKRGKKVVVIDDGKFGNGQTLVTTAHLVNALDRRYESIEKTRGVEAAHLAAESHTAAIERIGQIALEEGIACEFERLDGYLFLPPDGAIALLDREYDAARRTNVVRIDRVPRAPIADFDTGPCLRFQGQAQFHPLKYIAGLARSIIYKRSELFSSTHADSIEGGSPARVKTANGTITADAVVVATNTPVNDMVALHTKQVPYLTYAIAGRVSGDGSARALYWDTEDPFHYVRFRSVRKRPGTDDSNLLIVGGEDHRTGTANDADDRWARLESWARERFPSLGRIEQRWAGQVMDSIDGLAYIGRNPRDKDNVYIVTGDSGNGMTHGTIAGMVIPDLIQGVLNPWADLYDPKRVVVGAAGSFVRGLVGTATEYAKWLTPGDIKTIEELKRGEGGVLRSGVKKIAVYKDEHGKVTQKSAVCPHLGCLVAWNSGEQTWDCPCHGSRFSPTGDVLNGPANTPLPDLE
jgi:glycine/D-amino acid oxidase-like deaminating enzyme/nitrite reductase/ring-hydroxylating ferredoxin subunit